MFVLLVLGLSILFTISIAAILISIILNITRPNSKRSYKINNRVILLFFMFLFIGMVLSGTSFIPFVLINIFLIMFVTFGSIALTTRFYNVITVNKPHTLQTMVYLFTVLSIAAAGLGSVLSSDYLTFENNILLLFANVAMIFGFVIITFILEKLLKSRKNHSFKNPFVKKTSKDKMQHYYDAGLSDEEIAYLRDQLAELREHILAIDKQMNATAKLRAIDVRHNTIEISKQFFQDIVKEPNRFGEAGDVIYRIIPSIDDLTEKYNEVSEHIAKNKQTYLILEKSAQTIEELAERLTEEYIHFHKATYQDLDDEINLANRTLNRHQDAEQARSVDEILEDWNNMNDENNNEPKE